MIEVAEIARRGVAHMSDRVASLPILCLSVHSACNCRCVMCDIWKANAEKREITASDFERHIDGIRRLHVRRVMLTGGEPLLHQNLWGLCDRLKAEGVQITLVTTGLLIEAHARAISRAIDELVISVDGPPAIHDQVRRVPGGFARIARSLRELATQSTRPHVIARSVVQQLNYGVLTETVRATQQLGVDRVSFLAADVSSAAFNRPEPWDELRKAEVTVPHAQLDELTASIRRVESDCREALADGFIAGGMASLWRIRDYYAALAGLEPFPRVRCNAPWVSAVVEPGGLVRPCFFHQPYDSNTDTPFDEIVNSPSARAFRRDLDVRTNETCQRCVCSLWLPVWRRV